MGPFNIASFEISFSDCEWMRDDMGDLGKPIIVLDINTGSVVSKIAQEEFQPGSIFLLKENVKTEKTNKWANS
jgi:hypothetical protein